MQRVDVERVAASYRCRPKNNPSCGADVPVSRTTCPACRQHQRRPVAPEVPDDRLLANCVVYAEGRPIAFAGTVSREAAGYVAKVSAEWSPQQNSHPRLSGLGDRQAMFGTLAPQPLRQRYGCQRSLVSRSTPPARWQAIAAECHGALADVLPDVAQANVDAAGPIADVWKWAGTGWTSGVLNYTQLLPYHRDAGNLAGSWSAMIGARSATRGGHLYLPEYDVAFSVGHRSLLCFPGGDVTHGVTPMVVSRGGWRVTAVFYGLKQIKACACSEEDEITRSARIATARAREMARARRGR